MSYNNHGHNGGYVRPKSHGQSLYKDAYRLNKYHERSHYDGYSFGDKGNGYYNGAPDRDRAQTAPVSNGYKNSHIGSVPSTPSLNVAKNELVGTDMTTGENPHDNQFTKLLIHADFRSDTSFRLPDPKKNFKVVYDPELDKSLSKSDKKTKSKKIKFHEETDDQPVKDPRLSFNGGLESYLKKPNKRSKKFPFKQLPQTKFIYDKHSLGPAPLNELVIWELPATISEIYLSNFFRSYGSAIKDLKFVNDSENGVPLGIVTFKFQGNPEKATRLAEKVVQDSKTEGIKLDGVKIKIELNDHEGKLLDTKIKAAEGKLRLSKLRREEEEKRRIKEAEDLRRKQQEQEKKAQLQNASKQEPDGVPRDKGFKSNCTITSMRNGNRIIPGVSFPQDLTKYIKDRPFLLINARFVATREIASNDIKRLLNKYNWRRILPDRTGIYIVFNSLKECERCFYKEDGATFYSHKLYMDMCIPEGFEGDEIIGDTVKSTDAVNEASNMLLKEFETYLTKDIRERIIAPAVLDLLSPDKYPELMAEVKAKEAAIKRETAPPVFTTPKLKENALSVLASKRSQTVQPLPSFRKKTVITNKKLNGTSSASQSKLKKSVIPMLHALNFDNDSEDSEDDSSRSVTPLTPNLKRQHSSTSTSIAEKEEKEGPKKRKVQKAFLFDSSDEDMGTEEKEKAQQEEEEDMEVDEEEEEGVDKDIDYSNLDEIYQPTYDFPHPVYEDIPTWPKSTLDIDILQQTVKDDEDYELLKEVLKESPRSGEINNVEYFAWKLKEASRAESSLQGGVDPTEEEELITSLDARLDSETGAFKSDGYKKIPDNDKIEYLPHRRKVHKPLKTVQHDDVDNDKSNNQQSTNTHSSRVNRANNRRFAADISAQKQMIGSETDILNLNALTKRKKPVSFARSAIHNWGLYALEPIAAKEMIIEYVGESIRQQVAEHRERSYLKTGIGSSYLFRIDENTVIDATKKGAIARFINHCCSPSCTAKIIKVEGKKRIVIYALRDIEANEELTYDYKFEREINDSERIRCLCGAPGCKGYLN